MVYILSIIVLGLLAALLIAMRKKSEDLNHAVRTGSVDSITAILRQRPDLLHQRNAAGETPLHQAASYGELRALRLIVELGGDPNVRTPEGVTPLHLAAAAGKLDVVRYLLQLGANPNQSDSTGLTPLAAANFHGHGHVVQALRATGATGDLTLPPLSRPQEDPLMTRACERARASRDTLLKLYRQHPDATMVKIPFTTDSEVQERIWCDLVSVHGDRIKCRIRTYPVSQVARIDLTQEFALDTVEDWQVDQGDGTIRGGFGFSVMFEQCRRENGGTLPAAVAQHRDRYVDLAQG